MYSMHKYTIKDICVIIPTKDRPQYITNLLESITKFNREIGRVIIIASGEDIKNVISQFKNKLPIEYIHTKESGQIHQRNLGIAMLNDDTKLTACIDDDIEFCEGSFSAMIKLWNDVPVETAGISFNIIDNTSSESKLNFKINNLIKIKPGKVFVTGGTTSINNVAETVSTQWLCGGATVWRQSLLLQYPHKEVKTKWAIGEDLIFSYPIGKKYPMYVCAKAKVTHNHHPYATNDRDWHYMYGRTQTLWIYYFVSQNKELSRLLFMLYLFTRLIVKLFFGLVKRNNNNIYFVKGSLAAVKLITKFAVLSRERVDVRMC